MSRDRRAMRGGQHDCAGLPLTWSIVMNVLGDERHELIADKARLTGTGFGNRHPTIDRGARDFQLRALTEDSDDLGVLHRLSPKIDVDRRDDSGSGAKGRCGSD